MKNKSKRITAFLLATVLALSVGIFSLKEERFYKVKADTAVSTGFNNFAQSYFSNLKENFGVNAFNSCAQVALGMLLSYYDSCLNDGVIPEVYDVSGSNTSSNFHTSGKSPGVRYAEYLNSIGPAELNLLLEVAEVLQNTMFCEKLICMGNELDYYKSDFSLTVQETANLLNYYLQQETTFLSSDYSITSEVYSPALISESNNNKTNEVIQLVQSGQPVILFLVKPSEAGTGTIKHTVIAYDYDMATDQLYCHFGEHSTNALDVKSHVTPRSENYFQHYGYVAIDWNIKHSCSNNYELNGNYYCYEHKDLIIFDHLCSYTDGIQEFERNDTTGHTKHKKMCHCTNYVEENHTSTCGCYISAHVGIMYGYYSATQHSYVCTLCGVTAYAPHVAKKNNPGYCITCGSYFDGGFGQIIHAIKPNGGMVTANGSYIGYNGIIYLDDRDVQAYFNGTLVFYKEDSSSQTA